METLDTAVRRVLAAKFRLGLFENPYADPALAEIVNDSQEHRQLAREAAQKAMVLLQNENGTLPFRKDIRSIAVVGPLADAVRLGGYSGGGMATVSVLEGIKKALPGTDVIFAPGPGIESQTYPVVPAEYLTPAEGKSGEHGLKGEYFDNTSFSGKPALVRIDKRIHFDWGGGSPDPKIKPDQFSVRWTGRMEAPVTGLHKIIVTTDDGVRVFINGKLVDETWQDRAPTPDFIPVQMNKGQTFDLAIEYYENGGGASAVLGWDIEEKKEDDSEIREVVEAVKKAEATVVVVGVNEGEGRDRADIGLTRKLEKLVLSVADAGKPTAVVLINGSAVTMGNWLHKVGAVLEAWYPGEEGGNAVADVLFGDVNPGGKLPITFPLSVAQCPLYYNYKPTGRGYDYVDLPGKPQFPFGYGLSYTTFAFGNLRLSASSIRPFESVRASVDVTNTGSVPGDEVVQLYIHDAVGSVSRPVKDLKGFRRVALLPGETRTVEFTLTPEHLAMWDKDMRWVVEPGVFEIMAGGSSADVRLRENLEVVE
jgi:beta-glucosidase